MSDAQDPDPADVFARLADPTRVSILVALDGADATPLPFSALHDRVGGGDSARFNYHLQKLRPGFVRKEADGYALSAAGHRVVRAIRAGTYGETPRIGETAVESECGACGTPGLRAAYEGGRITLDCPDCGDRLLEVGFPPSGVRDRDMAGVLDAFDRWSRLQVAQATAGVCPTCAGVVEGEVTEVDDFPTLATFRCRVCEWRGSSSLGAVARRDERVRDFHRRHGVDLREGYYWEIPQCISDEYVEVRSRDPWRVAVDFPIGEETCRAVVDGDLDVVRVDGSSEFQ